MTTTGFLIFLSIFTFLPFANADYSHCSKTELKRGCYDSPSTCYNTTGPEKCGKGRTSDGQEIDVCMPGDPIVACTEDRCFCPPTKKEKEKMRKERCERARSCYWWAFCEVPSYCDKY